MGDVNITYETLFELLRREKNREELQKLDNSFFDDILGYITEKKEQLGSLQSKDDLFAVEEKKKAIIQDDNIRKILRELYEKREKKIIAMAMDKSRASASVIDTSTLLNKEKVLYDNIVELLNCFRKGILMNLLEGKGAVICDSELKIQEPAEKSDEEEKKEEVVKRVKISEFVEKFIGSDVKEYGPFEDGDTAELPEDVADLLIDKGSAEDLID